MNPQFSADDIVKLLDAHERQHSDEVALEECEHAETECGHCIDCGKYVRTLPDYEKEGH
jgi:hypothetical protein